MTRYRALPTLCLLAASVLPPPTVGIPRAGARVRGDGRPCCRGVALRLELTDEA